MFKRLILLSLMLSGMVGWLMRRQWVTRVAGLPNPRYAVRVERGIAIPMRDGAKLIADRYFPDTLSPYPVILIRSPYGRNIRAGAFGMVTEFCARRFAEQGFGVVVQDVRGRFDSGDVFEPFTHERDDGWDMLDWLSAQTWCASIGMWGSSYLGIVQWAAADHPAVGALMPMITASNVYETAFPQGVFNLDLGARWIAILNLQERYKRRPLLGSVALVAGVEQSAQRAFKHVPLMEADSQLPQGTVRYYQTWLKEHLEGTDLQRYFPHARYEDVKAPMLLVGGWYDFFLPGLLNDYAAMSAAGHAPHLIVGQWTHYSYLFLMLNTLGIAVRWFSETLNKQGGKSPKSGDNPVKLYMMGRKTWQRYETFPPPAREERLYISENGRLGDDVGNGADSFTFDPAAPPPMIGGAQFSIKGGAQPNHVLECRDDVLVYTSSPLSSALEIVGFVRAELYVRATCETADFFARLCVVKRRGRSINLCDGLIRASADCGAAQQDASLRVVVNMGATAYRFRKGERIRLLIAGSGHPRWTRHTGGKNPMTDTTLTPIEQTVYHDAAHPSALVLPVIAEQ